MYKIYAICVQAGLLVGGAVPLQSRCRLRSSPWLVSISSLEEKKFTAIFPASTTFLLLQIVALALSFKVSSMTHQFGFACIANAHEICSGGYKLSCRKIASTSLTVVTLLVQNSSCLANSADWGVSQPIDVTAWWTSHHSPPLSISFCCPKDQLRKTLSARQPSL